MNYISLKSASIISVITDLRPVAQIKSLQFRCSTMEPSFIKNFKIWTNKVINGPLPLGISKSGYPKISTTIVEPNKLVNCQYPSADPKFSRTVCNIGKQTKIYHPGFYDDPHQIKLTPMGVRSWWIDLCKLCFIHIFHCRQSFNINYSIHSMTISVDLHFKYCKEKTKAFYKNGKTL